MRLLLATCYLFAISSALAQEAPFTTCDNCWNPDTLGNHRAVLRVPTPGKAAHVRIPWRRRDLHPESKNILITDAAGNRVRNVHRIQINREEGELRFEPTLGAGVYYLYYLPQRSKGRSNYPTITYPPFQETAAPAWRNAPADAEAVVESFQSIDSLNSFYPMELIATQAEINSMRSAHNDRRYLVFPEDRLHPVKMPYLPYRWRKGPADSFRGEARRGENFSYQLAVFSPDRPLHNVRVTFSDLTSGRATTPAGSISCLMTDGVAYDGKPLHKVVDVPATTVQSLWCLAGIPATASPGVYEGTATVTADGEPPTTVRIQIAVTGDLVSDGGVSEPWKQTRLTWLNSTLAASDDVIAPYVPLTVTGTAISLLGRKITLQPNGLPRAIDTYFRPEMTAVGATPNPVLAAPAQFVVEDAQGKALVWKEAGLQFTQKDPGKVAWSAKASTSDLTMNVTGQIEFDGYVSYQIQLTAVQDVTLHDVRLDIPFHPAAATYLMGLGRTGGYRPDTLRWKWEVATKNQDGAWIGSVNAGLQFSLRDEHYVRPLNTNFYLQKPLLLPTSWGNEGKGGINLSTQRGQVRLSAYSGGRTMKQGEVLYYNCTLLITPFHTLQTNFQWQSRFYHKYSPIDTVIARGSTVINIHHANAINPYINYPFLSVPALKAYIDEAHEKGLKVKIYNTVRELSNRAWETHPMRSLGTEIYSPGSGGGFSWLQEHLGENYIAAWFVPELKDAAIINSGMSRWHNYYVEGMNWLAKNVGIDGIYLDDVAFDRTTMKRVRRVLASERGPGIIDLHSANQYNKRDGFNNSANLYLEHFPYLNRLWFGEYFDYDKAPDFWLVEVSGIPFGLMGEMLEKGGNKWRGMLYGMTNRMPYDGNDPSHIWKVWDQFGMQDSEMLGYWLPDQPVKTNRSDVLATVYRKQDATLIALASWAPEDVKVQLTIDWKKLGLSPKAQLKIPAVTQFQEAQVATGNIVTVPRGKGLMIIVQ
ncbi:MAG: hypothetical protein K1X47_15250 [Cyclobacteriaceae bacterium]|nr:hypothetical protein [Cyclobacteriaceae bacterium]